MNSNAILGSISRAASTVDKRLFNGAFSSCTSANCSFSTPNSVLARPSRLPCSTCFLETRARSQMAQVSGSSQVATASTLRREALVEVLVMDCRLESVNSLPATFRLDCSSTRSFLTETSIISERFFNAFCLAVAMRSASGARGASDTPAARRYSRVTDAGLSTQSGRAPLPVHCAAKDRGENAHSNATANDTRLIIKGYLLPEITPHPT